MNHEDKSMRRLCSSRGKPVLTKNDFARLEKVIRLQQLGRLRSSNLLSRGVITLEGTLNSPMLQSERDRCVIDVAIAKEKECSFYHASSRNSRTAVITRGLLH
jgi:hypothetical protein